MTGPEEAVARATAVLRDRLVEPPRLLITLGSGLGSVADAVTDPVDILVSEVPDLPVSSVPGHAGVLRGGRLGDAPVLVQQGRVHLYEGHSAHEVARVVDVAAELGAETFVVINAAGGLVQGWSPGDLMVIEDHLNLTGHSPLTGVLRGAAPVFVDMAGAYDDGLRRTARDAAATLGIDLRTGVYAGLTGPAYETSAEVEMLRRLGAHAVGMSTVLEVIAARSQGMRVLGLSSITNVHGPGVETSHAEVLEVGRIAAGRLAELVLAVVSGT